MTPRGTVIVAEDEPRQREALARSVRDLGHQVVAVADGAGVLESLGREDVDAILTDLRMPGLSGIDVVRRARELQPDVAVIVLTAYGSIADAVSAIKAGAADFLGKPIDLDQLEMVLSRALDRRELVRENRRLRERIVERREGFAMLGDSPALLETLARAGRAAETTATVLVRGESGTGKELLARSIHALSRRSDGPFVAVNCAALPETMLESELFGHERGSFTGAVGLHRGRIEAASGGTLFLDEIGDLPAHVQVKLLRFLQEREYIRVGGEQVRKADVRIVAATHRDLEAMQRAGAFREDLYYRLNVVSLTLPPLRERRDDIPRLAEYFLARHAQRYDRPVPSISREAMDALLRYPFPGNVRELENILEQATVLASSPLITRDDLPPGVTNSAPSSRPDSAFPPEVEGDLAGVLDRFERQIVLATLARHGGNQTGAARQLGLTEGGLRYKLRRWRGDAPDAGANRSEEQSPADS